MESRASRDGKFYSATICDKLNIMASIHNRKLIVALMRGLNQRDLIIEKVEERLLSLEDQVKQINGTRAKEKNQKECDIM
ncbi:MAG: hypothetical protein WA323_05865 [Candidatus Nitrosopolaris sp.]|jgi:hypothetical protein